MTQKNFMSARALTMEEMEKNFMSARALTMEEMENVNGGYVLRNDLVGRGKCQLEVRV